MNETEKMNLPQGSSISMGSGGDASMRHENDGRPRDESCDYLRSILVNFNSLYMEKLRMIDDLVTEGSEEQKKLLLEKKTNMLENWAKEVCVHNMVLVHTVEELEREANRKVSALQKKMTESTQLAKEHMTMIKKYEEQVKLLLKDHSDTEEKNLVLKIELEKLESECRRVRDRMNMMLKDNESLLTLVCRIRDMGVWDVNGLELQRSSFDQIFGLYPNLVGGEVQTVFTRQKARHVEDTEKRLIDLEEQLNYLQKSKTEAEFFVMQKDRKIEDLEMEIKNVLNKAHYCERECNDYKRSLLETQEKLLEATRRLTQCSTKALKNNDLGESEMAELLRELRDVKSQLNTAVEEKHSAKEESNYFRRELSERLKETHDIQNVFQNLATEVVNSRVAFQHVQEKEVQLQSLKSDVQTYQSRCANAEDTVRRKEKEIEQLQIQLDEIHKRRDVETVASAPSLYSKDEFGKQNRKMCNRRNISSPKPLLKSKTKCSNVVTPTPSRLPLINVKSMENKQQTNQNVIPAWVQKGERPPWNIHFKKSTGLLSLLPPVLPAVTKSTVLKPSRSRSQSSLIRSSLAKTEVGLDSMDHDCQDIYEKITDLQRHISKGNRRITRSSSNSALETRNTEKLYKLPKIVSQHFKREQKQSLHISPAVSELKDGKLPVVQDPSSKLRTPSNRPNKNFLKTLIPVPDPRAPPTPRMNTLINAVVETTKKLLAESIPETEGGKPPRGQSYTVTAAHHRRRRPREDATPFLRRTKSSEKNAEVNRGSTGDTLENLMKSLNVVKKFHSSTEVTKNDGGHHNGDDNDEPVEIIYESPQNVKDYLSKLPEDSCEDIVHSWIRKSSSHSVKEDINKVKHTKSLPLRRRQRSVRIMKHLATRRYPKPCSAISNRSSELTEELQNEMFELEEEWGKVFANLEHHTNGPTKESAIAKLVEKADMGKQVERPGGPTKPQSFEATKQDPTHSSSLVQTSAIQSKAPPNSGQSNGTKCQEKESMEELLSRLTTEKREMEERYRRELEDKNVELTMQKVTIQHLQDAYIALKRGQPIPVPQSVTGNKITANGNGSTNGHHKTNNNNNNNNNYSRILDV